MKRIVIVGATSGIGRGLAERMVARGERVAVLGRREEALCEMAALYPDNIVTCRCDVRQTEQIEPSLEKVREALGGIDLLVLSAGTGHLNPALDYGLEADTLATNVTGWTRVADWAMRCFLDQGHGHLVALTSIGGLRGSGMAPAYNASKAVLLWPPAPSSSEISTSSPLSSKSGRRPCFMFLMAGKTRWLMTS